MIIDITNMGDDIKDQRNESSWWIVLARAAGESAKTVLCVGVITVFWLLESVVFPIAVVPVDQKSQLAVYEDRNASLERQIQDLRRLIESLEGQLADQTRRQDQKILILETEISDLQLQLATKQDRIASLERDEENK